MSLSIYLLRDETSNIEGLQQMRSVLGQRNKFDVIILAMVKYLMCDDKLTWIITLSPSWFFKIGNINEINHNVVVKTGSGGVWL